jgi:hypothetical protein
VIIPAVDITPKQPSSFKSMPQTIPRQTPGQVSLTEALQTTKTTTMTRLVIHTQPKPRPIPKTIPRVIPRLQFVGKVLRNKAKKADYTGISDLSVANIAAPSFSIATGKGDQAKAAERLLGGSTKKGNRRPEKGTGKE